MPLIEEINSPVILFDGVCNLCSNVVQFVIKKDKKNQYQFASLQSSFGESVIKKYNLSGQYLNTFILLQNDKVYTKSTGALMVAKNLSGFWPALYIFILIPPFIRNFVYDIISKYRYTWFGKNEICWIPSPKLKSKFLNDL